MKGVGVVFSTVFLIACCSCNCNAFSSIAASTGSSSTKALSDFDYNANNGIPWIEDGYDTWEWRGQKINYLEMGDSSKPKVLLIHGFGASVFHFRYNIPALARDYHVYAIDLLGFGLSSKPIQEYTAETWRDQTVDFVTEVIKEPTTLVGNSIGGFTALYASSTDKAKPLVNGCVSLNGAGRFRDPTAEEKPEPNAFVQSIQKGIQRLVIAASFIYTKQPARIEQVLRQVYPINDDNVDDELVESIRFPSLDPNAAEVFYRVIARNGGGQTITVDDCLDNLECPLLLCWGEHDPWIKPAAADKMQALYPKAQRVSINAGHCPQDEAPEEVNAAIRGFMEAL